MPEGAEIRYARSAGGVDVAYQVLGSGPVDLVFVSGFTTHLELAWDLPHFQWLERLDGVARVITFDKRGTGLSDRSLGFGSIEERTDDIRAVMDAVGSEQAFLLGVSEGGPMCLLFAATFPERVRGLLLYGTGARFSAADDYPMGVEPAAGEQFVEFVADQWGTGKVFGSFIQNAVDPAAAQRTTARFERNACTPQMATEIAKRNLEIDVRPLLGLVQVPTLITHATGDPIVPIGCARYLADHLPNARLSELPGRFHASWLPGEVELWAEEVAAFLTEEGQLAAPSQRALATVLFTDIVASTQMAAHLGDSAWHGILDQHDRIAATTIARHRGRLVKNTGDGVLATCDGPGRAIACAQAMSEALLPLGVELRAGVHTGEVELRGDDIAGMGVVIARRICDLGEAGDVLVSRTVKDLVTGSGIELAARGHHVLKGVPEEWELYAAA